MDDSDKCHECGSDDIQIESARDRLAKPKKGPNPGEPTRVVAKTYWVRCNNCGNSWPVTRKVN